MKEAFDIVVIWSELWKKKIFIILFTAVFATAAVFYALSLPNLYRSEAVLVPTSGTKSSGLSSLANQFGGLASLAGINLGAGSTSHVVIQRLKSRDFIAGFIKKRELLVPLFASTGWNSAKQTLLYEQPDIYDFTEKKWIREVKYPLQPKPSDDEAYVLFSTMFAVDMDRKTKIIKLSLELASPELSQQWLSWLISDFNEYVRAIKIKEFSGNMAYLTSKVEQTHLAEMKQVFYGLIEEQTKKVMLAEVQEEYAVQTIDKPAIPSKRSAPRRAIIAIAGTLLGGILSVGFVLLLFFRRQSRL